MAGFKDKELASRAGQVSSRKGVPNRNTAQIRKMIRQVVDNNIETLQADLDSMKSTERVKAILELMKFVLPTLRSVEVTDGDFEGDQKINEITINILHNGQN